MTSIPPSARQRITATSLTVLALATVMSVSGCSVPGMPGPTGAPTAQKAAVIEITNPAATTDPAQKNSNETPAPRAPTWVPVIGDLSHGSATHTLGAAARSLIIDYWMIDDAARLTPDDAPIIRLNAHLDGAPDETTIKVTRFNARALGTVLANDQGDFAVQPPYSYSSGVVVPANPTAHSTQVVFTFDLLTETAPGTGIYTRQTVLDTLTLGYALPGAAAQK